MMVNEERIRQATTVQDHLEQISRAVIDPEMTQALGGRDGLGMGREIGERLQALVKEHWRWLDKGRARAAFGLETRLRWLRDNVAEAILADAARRPDGGPALLLLWQRVQSRVAALAAAYARPGGQQRGVDVNDLKQEAFLKLCKVIDRYDPDRPFWVWLEVVLRRLFLGLTQRRKQRRVGGGRETGATDEVRHGGRQRPAEVVSLSPELAERVAECGARSFVETVYRQELCEVVHDVFEQLTANGFPADHLQAFRMWYLEEMTLKEIGEQLGRSITWVHRAVRRSTDAWKQQLKRAYPGLADELSGSAIAPRV